jgi:methylase of polypeptide subunit release factors
MNYSSISIQGNIFTSEILEKIRQEDTRFQAAKDFNLNQGDSVRDEINLAWNLANSNWNAFRQKRENLVDTDTGTTETRKYWVLPLLQILGYNASTSYAEIVNEKSYAVSHRANNKDGFPIHIVGIQQSLDKKADIGGARLSPHALIQEYLNNTEHLYGFATNGAMLRVLRDATRLSRLSYIEFNLEQMMEEGLYVEFALLYRILHSSRIANKKEENAESILEWYHQEALSSGSRIRERLSQAVEQSILLLANGILENPNNEVLRQEIEDNKITPQQYYLHVLRSVYRVLFLLVIEERKLIYPEKRDAELNRKRDVYYRFYSIQRLTYLVEKKVYIDPRKTDLWQSLLTTFNLFEHSEEGAKLGISALGSGLFAPNALGGLQDQLVNNETLLKVLRYLVTFENENRQLVRVNYADLDVEEFGSVYEGLLEYAPAITNYQFNFIKGDERSSTGSHYTPEELVKPLIVHSLDYLIADKLKEENPEAGLLSLSICDVACGSGHILLSAARRVGFELAKYRSKEDQPTPSVLRIAVRDVIKNCIYGVDLNPLAVELCKVALWLEAHEPGQPMNFLDHHIKCGNAIVGLAHFEELENGIASEAFKTLPGDNKEIAAAFKKRNDLERKTKGQLSTYDVAKADNDLKGLQKEFTSFSKLPENTPEQIANKERVYQSLSNGKKWMRLKNIADLQVSQFFIPKTEANKEKLTTHSQYMSYLKTEAQIIDRGESMSISQKKHFFHWFLEFPQVFQNGGFDCILGNPPYLGAKYVSGKVGNDALNYFKQNYFPAQGRCDLVTYFIRRINDVTNIKGFYSIISTNSISQGDTKDGGIKYILHENKLNTKIVFANKSIDWPGVANVNVTLISIAKNAIEIPLILNGKRVEVISEILDDTVEDLNCYSLEGNKDKSFQGSIILGEGFLIKEHEAIALIKMNKIYSDVLFPYIGGADVLKIPNQKAPKWVINFQDFKIEKAEKYELVFKKVEESVKPYRQRWVLDKSGKQIIGEYALRKPLPQKWWIHAEKRPKLYETICRLTKVIVTPLVSKYLTFSVLETGQVFNNKLCVIAYDENFKLSVLQSSVHEIWSWKFCTTMGAATLNYNPSKAFDTFPFPNKTGAKVEIINSYFDVRKKLMAEMWLGLTDVYNQFHNKYLVSQVEYLDAKSFEKNYGKETWNLFNHLKIKKTGNGSYEEAVSVIRELRALHIEMDKAVLEAYGWQDIALRHDFYEVDYLPENDRVRYTIHPEARKEVLKRLLELNHKIHEEELAAGLWEKKKAIKKEKVVKKTGNVVSEPFEPYNQPELFGEDNLFSEEK